MFSARKNANEQFYMTSQDPYGIYPYKGIRRAWEYVMFIMSMVSIWEIPFDWTFKFERTASYVLPALAIDIFFIFDLYVFYHTGILSYGVVSLDKKSILRSIPTWKMVIYWTAPWPFYLIGWFSKSRLAYNILVLFKALRILRLYNAHSVIRNSIVYISPFSRIFTLFGFLLTIIQYCTCAFWAAGYYQKDYDKSWIVQSGLDGQPLFTQYFHTLYFISTTVLTIGYGDLHPYTFDELLTIIVIEFLGVLYYNYLVSNFVSIIADPTRSSFYKSFRNIYSTFRSHGLTNASLHELLTFYEYVWAKDKNRTEFYNAASKLPDGLQKKLELALHMEVFNSVESLRDKPEAALEKVALALKPRIFTPGDCLVKAGHVSKRMYFITNGRLNAYSSLGSLLQTMDGVHGCVLGEPSLILGRSEAATVIAETFVEAFELSKADYDEIPELHPALDDIQNNPILSAVANVHL